MGIEDTLTFIGHLSRDVNIVRGASTVLRGGGVFHNGITACRLGVHAVVLTRCAPDDQDAMTLDLVEAGVDVRVRSGSTTTSIENLYPDANPDSRQSRLLQAGPVFEAADLEGVDGDMIHVNPLWFGEFPVDLLPEVRKRCRVLGGDAQGFLRHVGENGLMFLEDWDEKLRWLPLFDVFKADLREAEVLTGETEVRAAAGALHAMGVREVVLTHGSGLCVRNGTGCFHGDFGPYSLDARTGRGDTCTAAYLVARTRMPPAEAARFAADVTARKLQYPGPFRG
jgi:sugar/nucleoside kinase (ribokinase family)